MNQFIRKQFDADTMDRNGTPEPEYKKKYAVAILKHPPVPNPTQTGIVTVLTSDNPEKWFETEKEAEDVAIGYITNPLTTQVQGVTIIPIYTKK